MTRIPQGVAPADLPSTYLQAAMRGGWHGLCPRCGKARLFRKWLKPVDSCPACHQDWSLQCADDFPPYIGIIVTGHVMAPVLIMLSLDFQLPMLAVAAIALPMALAIMLAVLQPAKGAIIAAQWWLGLVGFTRERPPAAPDSDGP